jgi:long-subunit acyl-CoA synthetase (AMP-forming)
MVQNDLGKPLPGVTLKLNGDEGELLVKTSSLFLGFVSKPSFL